MNKLRDRNTFEFKNKDIDFRLGYPLTKEKRI